MQVKASFRKNVTALFSADWFLGNRPRPLKELQAPRPRPRVSLSLPPRWGFVSICLSLVPRTLYSPLPDLDMTFRRLKKVDSSGPEVGPCSRDAEVYFPSSSSDGCRTGELQSIGSGVYSHKTLAYSGGTLPRNFKKVRRRFQNLLSLCCTCWLQVCRGFLGWLFQLWESWR